MNTIINQTSLIEIDFCNLRNGELFYAGPVLDSQSYYRSGDAQATDKNGNTTNNILATEKVRRIVYHETTTLGN